MTQEEALQQMLADPAEMAERFADLPPYDRPKLKEKFWWIAEYTTASPLPEAAK